jgi:AcrR family transcriptional regulator
MATNAESASTQRANWVRARRTGERDERVRLIIEGARDLVVASGRATSLSITDLAQAGGMSPAGLYKYFTGREAILLAVLEEDLELWLNSSAKALAAVPANQRKGIERRIAHLVCVSLAEYPSLPPLLVALSNELEASASQKAISDFKLRAAAELERVSEQLDRLLPGIDGPRMMTYLRALIVGLWSFGRTGALATSRVWLITEVERAFAELLTGTQK